MTAYMDKFGYIESQRDRLIDILACKVDKEVAEKVQIIRGLHADIRISQSHTDIEEKFDEVNKLLAGL